MKMVQREDIIEVNAPTVDIYQPEGELELRYSSDIMYSVQLSNGLIVTSPEKFPNQQPTRTPQTP
jgi:hypothetical protein